MSIVDVSSTVDVSITGSTVVVYSCTLSVSVNCGKVISVACSVVALSVVAIVSIRFSVGGRVSGTKRILSDGLAGSAGASLI